MKGIKKLKLVVGKQNIGEKYISTLENQNNF